MMNRGGGQVAVPVPIKDSSSAATAQPVLDFSGRRYSPRLERRQVCNMK